MKIFTISNCQSSKNNDVITIKKEKHVYNINSKMSSQDVTKELKDHVEFLEEMIEELIKNC